jgi:hypothetical protein
MSRQLRCTVVATLMLSALAAPESYAEIQGTSGGVVQIEPPPSVMIGDLESDTEIRAFDELQNLLLPEDVAVNISSPGTYDDPDDLTPATLAAGTSVCSHFLHADRVGNEASVRVQGSVTFSSEILGVIVLDTELNASDGILGLPGTQYPTGSDTRDLELSSTEDSVTLEPDMRTLTVDLRFGQVADQIRVITTIPSVSVPQQGWGKIKAQYVRESE